MAEHVYEVPGATEDAMLQVVLPLVPAVTSVKYNWALPELIVTEPALSTVI